MPKRGIGPSSVEKSKPMHFKNNISMFDALAEVDFIGLSKKVTQECISFYEMIQNLIKEQEFLEISEIVDEVLQKSGYRTCLIENKVLNHEVD